MIASKRSSSVGEAEEMNGAILINPLFFCRNKMSTAHSGREQWGDNPLVHLHTAQNPTALHSSPHYYTPPPATVSSHFHHTINHHLIVSLTASHFYHRHVYQRSTYIIRRTYPNLGAFEGTNAEAVANRVAARTTFILIVVLIIEL